MAMTVCALAIPLATGDAESAGARTTLGGSVPRYATQAREVGAAHGRVEFSVVLSWRHENRLERFNDTVSDPESSRYARYLSASEFRDRFSPTVAQVSAVRRWLRARGLEVIGVSASRMMVGAAGGIADIERAFHTSLRMYRSRGRKLRAPASPITLPARLGGSVLAVVGLDETWYSPDTESVAPPAPANRNARPCSHYWGEKIATHKPSAYGSKRPWVVCGYRPHQFQSAYGVRRAIKQGRDGSGQRIAIIDAFKSPTLRQDLNEFSRRHGLPRARLTTKRFHGCRVMCGAKSQQGWYGEQALDVTAAHTMAPGARLMFIGAFDPNLGLLEAVAWAVDHRVARIVSNSYGGPDADNPPGQIAAEEQIAKQAIAEGIGLYFSTGDHGDYKAEVGYVTTQYPASSPHVTAMGGNSLAIGPVRNFRFETGWGLYSTELSGRAWSPAPPGTFESGGSGGTTRLFAEPRYQKGVVPGRLAKRFGGHGRVLPDISMDGDPSTGALVGQTQTFPDGSTRYNEYSVGGTSLASPLFAGYMALADASAGFHHGFVNPALYRLYGRKPIRDVKPAPTRIAQVLNAFTNHVNRRGGVETGLLTGDMDSSLRTTKGYDNTTGLGSPRGRQLLRALKHR
jgi:subtilase family serine protease